MEQHNKFTSKPLGKLAAILAIILIFLLLLILSLPAMGNFLVAEDEPQKADIIVVLMGSAMNSLEREIRVISCPTKYDDFNADRWWKDREDLKRGALEYLKLMHFYVKEQFEL